MVYIGVGVKEGVWYFILDSGGGAINLVSTGVTSNRLFSPESSAILKGGADLSSTI